MIQKLLRVKHGEIRGNLGAGTQTSDCPARIIPRNGKSLEVMELSGQGGDKSLPMPIEILQILQGLQQRQASIGYPIDALFT